jgi:hypothetical protein
MKVTGTSETRVARKRQHEELSGIVAAVIAEWDPYSLLAGGAPRDEFDPEVSSIVRQVSRIKSATDAAHVISRVFSSSFEQKQFRPEACATVGQRLFAELQAHGFVS